MNSLRRGFYLAIVLLGCLILITGEADAQAQAQARPSLLESVQVSLGGNSGDGFTLPVRIAIFLTLLVFIPSILMSMSAFIRIIVVLHFLRQAIGTQQVPSNQIMIGLSLFLTLFVMGPVWDQVYKQSVEPFESGQLNELEALGKAEVPVKGFMLRQVRESDLALFVRISKTPRPKTPEELPLRVVVPAFMISELKTAFNIGFVLFLPFLIIDMVISSVLLSMGMMQLPPIMISAPFKILLFILVDGWHLVVGSLVDSFRM